MLRSSLTTTVVSLLACGALAAQPLPVPPRYNVTADLQTYPQATPRDALASLVRALERGQAEYALAHLADPEFVDNRLRLGGQRFEQMAREAADKLTDDPETFKDLRRLLAAGEFRETEAGASVGHKDVPGRQVFFVKRGERWFVENRKK